MKLHRVMPAIDRPRRNPKPVKTYWEEYVETDEWYQSELLADIPEHEMQAAIEDSDWSDYDSALSEQEQDLDYSESNYNADGGDASDEWESDSESTELAVDDETGESDDADDIECTDASESESALSDE